MAEARAVGVRLRALGLLATAPVVALLAPSPSTAWDALSDARHPAAPLVGLVALAAWACTAWLALLVTLTWGAHVPGVLGRVAARVSAQIAPASVRGLVRVALGTTVALSVLGGASAFAETRPAVTSSFEWPGASAQAPADPALDWATPTAAPVRLVPRPAAHRAGVHVPVAPAPAPVTHVPALVGRVLAATVVHQGDTLWGIAARSLGPDASPAQVAQAWPQWWSANRDVVGDHPELIHPGDHLVAPTH